jgi:DNA modification methylase
MVNTFEDKLFLMDARQLSDVFGSNTRVIDVTITSPPYWHLKDYDAKNQIGFGQTKAEYLLDVRKVLKKCLRVTKDTGSLWLVVDDFRKNGILQILPWEIAECARKAGWKLRDLIIWDKQHTLPWHVRGQMRSSSEFILFMSKTENYKFEIDRIKMLDEISKWWIEFPERFNPKGKTPTNIWSIPVRTQGMWRSRLSKISHHCPFPTALVARIVELTTNPGDMVMDPFAGSGIVLAQAAAMGRHFVGFEINRKYIRMFQDTVRREVSAEWIAMQHWRESQKKVAARFESTILKLRALKYARQVTKPFLENAMRNGKVRVKGILCLADLPQQFTRNHPFLVKISVIVDARADKFERALRKSRARTLQAPISHYGIKSDIEVVTSSAIKRRKSLGETRLYCYREYKPKKYSSKGTLRELFGDIHLSAISNGTKIPLLSNIRVDVAWAAESLKS